MATPSPVKKGITFLFGSGISVPANAPSTNAISHRVLSGKDIIRHTDGNYYFSDNDSPALPRGYVPRVTRFLKRLEQVAKSYYSGLPERAINYEDLAYLASQIADSESGEYDNPAIQPLIDSILPDIQHLLIPQDGETDRDWSLHTIASEATNYIRDVVWHFLNIQSNNLDYLNVIRDACKESESCDLFTLNHDTLLESYLTSIGIPFADGFGSLENGVRYWNPDILDKVTNGASVYKLHGSINWFRLRPDRGAISTERIGIPEDWDFWHTHNTAGALQMPVDGRPMFLVGTFNKILSYTDEVYFDLHYLFMRHIRTTDRLIVCGYSFGDKAINSQIARWVFDRPNRKLIICHPRVERVRDGARGAIRNNWERWQDNGNIEVVPKYIQNIIWSDLHSVL